MKKSISLLLAIFLLCVLTACSNMSKDITKGTNSSYQTTSISESLTAQQAKNIVINYLNSPLGTRELNDKLLDEISASSIKYLEISSIEDNENLTHTGQGSFPDYYYTIKGNFFGYDEYGTLKSRYIYTWIVHVNGLNKRPEVLYGRVYSK